MHEWICLTSAWTHIKQDPHLGWACPPPASSMGSAPMLQVRTMVHVRNKRPMHGNYPEHCHLIASMQALYLLQPARMHACFSPTLAFSNCFQLHGLGSGQHASRAACTRAFVKQCNPNVACMVRSHPGRTSGCVWSMAGCALADLRRLDTLNGNNISLRRRLQCSPATNFLASIALGLAGRCFL